MTAAKGALDYFTHQSRKQSYLLKSYQGTSEICPDPRSIFCAHCLKSS
mgnify:CR=1 FL=1